MSTIVSDYNLLPDLESGNSAEQERPFSVQDLEDDSQHAWCTSALADDNPFPCLSLDKEPPNGRPCSSPFATAIPHLDAPAPASFVTVTKRSRKPPARFTTTKIGNQLRHGSKARWRTCYRREAQTTSIRQFERASRPYDVWNLRQLKSSCPSVGGSSVASTSSSSTNGPPFVPQGML